MEENSNDLLLLGISILGLGILLAGYSISAYLEVKNLNEKIDFETLANRTDMSTSDKYYEYLSIDDFLEQKLEKNKNIPIKNISCVYLDYAQQNAIELYNLTYKKLDSNDSRRSVATGIIRKLYNTTDNYKTCKQADSYKKELNDILQKIQKSENLHIDYEQRMNEFLNTRRELPNNTLPAKTENAESTEPQTTPVSDAKYSNIPKDEEPGSYQTQQIQTNPQAN